jgi:TonB family protein
LSQVARALDLLGQASAPAAPVRLRTGHVPKLEIAWGSFHPGAASSAKTLLFETRAPKDFLGDNYFRDCWVQKRVPKRAVLAAALWHIVFVIFPFPQLPAIAKHNTAFENSQLTWSGPINDLPLLEIPAEKIKPSPRAEPDKPPPADVADTFHPRQRIFTDPVHPTHPRQTLVNSAAPPEAPKILPDLPNIVQLQQMAGPARPRIQISEKALARLHPRVERAATVTEVPPSDVPSFEQRTAEMNLPMSSNAPVKPLLQLNAGAAPRVAPRAQAGDAGPAPEVGATQSSAENGPPATFIALSAAPAPPAANEPPLGNLAARISISPDATLRATTAKGGGQDSAGETSTLSAASKSSIGISISGGNPPANGGVSGLAGTPKITVPRLHGLVTRPDPKVQIDDSPERTGPPNFATLPPGANPEQIFAAKRVYTLNVNMPNLNSATGSWILNFSELSMDMNAPRHSSVDLAGPVPLRKVDPKYPPTLQNEHVEGEVVLYAVIRRDGSVDSIQRVRGIDELLDDNAMKALSQWKFQPAKRQGAPVDLEAIVHIPFHAPSHR